MKRVAKTRSEVRLTVTMASKKKGLKKLVQKLMMVRSKVGM